MQRDIYNLRRWRRLRDLKLTEDPYCQCEECRVSGRKVLADQVDHIKPISEGGQAWAWDNLQSMYGPHHSRKTWHDQHGKRPKVRGVDAATGRPIDPEHYWNDERKISHS